MDHNGSVFSPALHLVDLLHHSDKGAWIRAPYLGTPVLDVELGHLVRLARLHIDREEQQYVEVLA